MYIATSTRFCATLVAVEKAISITYSEYVFVDFGIQHEMRLLRLSSVACPVLRIFPLHLTNGKIVEKVTGRKMFC